METVISLLFNQNPLVRSVLFPGMGLSIKYLIGCIKQNREQATFVLKTGIYPVLLFCFNTLEPRYGCLPQSADLSQTEKLAYIF